MSPVLWSLSALKPNDPSVSAAALQRQDGDAGLQVEAAGAGSTRVHDQRAARALDQRLVRMAVDDDVGAVGGEKPGRRRAPELVAVADVHVQALERQVDARREAWLAGTIGVAIDRVHRRDRAQLGENLPA